MLCLLQQPLGSDCVRTKIAFREAGCCREESATKWVDHGNDRPNIMLITAEDMSMRLGAFGDTAANTPHIDRFAAGSIRFPNMFVTSGVCAPGRYSFVSGRHQISDFAGHMRTRNHRLAYRALPPPNFKALSELLRESGYWTAVSNKADMQFGFDNDREGWTPPTTMWDQTGGDEFAWRNAPAGKPWFFDMNLWTTHEGNNFMDSFGFMNTPLSGSKYPELANVTQKFVGDYRQDPQKIAVPPYFPDIPVVREDMARMYNNIHLWDHIVGIILDTLQSDGMMDNTVIMYTHDHGDGLPRSKRELYDTGTRVPLILHMPPRFQDKYGMRGGSIDTRLISSVDWAPTILNLAGIRIPDYMHGSSLLNKEYDRKYVFSHRDRHDELNDWQRAVRDNRYKYIKSYMPDVAGGDPLAFRDAMPMMGVMRQMFENGTLDATQRLWFEPVGQERLYDVATDPYEVNDLLTDELSPTLNATLHRMRRTLDEFLVRVDDKRLAFPDEDEMAKHLSRTVWSGYAKNVTDARLKVCRTDGSCVTTHPNVVCDWPCECWGKSCKVACFSLTGTQFECYAPQNTRPPQVSYPPHSPYTDHIVAMSNSSTEYSVNGSAYQLYTRPVAYDSNTQYTFRSWRYGFEPSVAKRNPGEAHYALRAAVCSDGTYCRVQ